MPKKKRLAPKPQPLKPKDEEFSATLRQASHSEQTATTHKQGIALRTMECNVCGHRENLTLLADTQLSCPVCTKEYFRVRIPQMVEVVVPQPPPPPQEKPKLKPHLRYAKVIFEPINPLFRIIKFEDDGSEDKLHVHRNTPTLRHIQLVVKDNPDIVQGGWVIEREMARTLA